MSLSYDTSNLGKIKWIPLTKRSGDSSVNIFTEVLSDVMHTGLAATNGGLKQVGGLQSNSNITGDVIEEFLSYQMPVPTTDQYPLYYDTSTSSFKESFFYVPNQTQYVYKWIIQVPFIMDVNAFSSGNFNIGSVQAIIYDVVNNNKVLVDTSAISAGFSNMGNTGIQLCWLRFVAIAPYKMIGGNPIKITIQLVNTTTGTGTSYFGYLPVAPDTATNGIKSVYPAALGLLIQGTPDYAYSVLGDPKYGTTYNYGGVAKT